MSASEIKSFEDFWQLFTRLFYKVMDFLRSILDKEDADKVTNIVPQYPED